MDKDSSNGREKRDLEEVIDQEPDSKHGDEGQAAHGGEQAGPSSARSGQPIAPQAGDPRARDRRPN